MSDTLPVMDDPMGRHWRQPAQLRDAVLIDATHALLPEAVFMALPEYSTTIPSGVYPGKAWRMQDRDGTWRLRWYGPDIGGRCACEHRLALFP